MALEPTLDHWSERECSGSRTRCMATIRTVFSYFYFLNVSLESTYCFTFFLLLFLLITLSDRKELSRFFVSLFSDVRHKEKLLAKQAVQ